MLPRPLTLRHTALALVGTAAILLPAPASAQSTSRVSVDSWGVEGNQHSESAAISANGRFVAFSTKSRLVPGGSSLYDQVYLHDRETSETALVSANSSGYASNSFSLAPSVSGDGRYVVFLSYADNLDGATGGYLQVFVRDRQLSTTVMLSVDAAGAPANHHCYTVEISEDGSVVAFDSRATNLVPNDTSTFEDVFVCDLLSGALSRVSVDSSGVPADQQSVRPTLSADGRYVAFDSNATNLVAGDTNRRTDVFAHDRQSGRTTRVSVDSTGRQSDESSSNPSLSGDGRYVAFEAYSGIFVHDRITGRTTLESKSAAGTPGNSQSHHASLSATGRYLAFSSGATNLVTGDVNGWHDVFLRDRHTGEVTLLSQSTAGVPSDWISKEPAIARNAGVVAFLSHGTTLVDGDANNRSDVFVRGIERRPVLARSGWSGGVVNLTVTDATPFGQVALLYGPPGQFARQAGPCAGLLIDLSAPRLESILTADAAGAASYSFFAPDQAAGFAAQVVDLVSCMPSGTALLQPRVFQLSKSAGLCGGAFLLDLDVTEATPFSTVALLYGNAGSYLKPGGACAGITIGLAAPTVLAMLTADSIGSAQYLFRPPPALCGLTVQAVELGACVVSNTVVL